MGNRLLRAVRASELADALEVSHKGNDHLFDCVLPLNLATSSTLTFSRSCLSEPRTDSAVVIAPPGSPVSVGTIIESSNPRLTFSKALNLLTKNPGFVKWNAPARIHPDAVVSATAVIGNGVKIGKGSIINHFVVIHDGVQIGEDCYIKSGAVIGEDGFGFERDIDGTPIRMPHLGEVIIGNRVEIGSYTTVCRGTLSHTIIEDDVKIDDHVQVSHNCLIRRGAMVVACAQLSGGVELGEYSWIGPNASVLQKLTIGQNAFVGLGANVLRPVAPGDKVAGYPARSLGPAV